MNETRTNSVLMIGVVIFMVLVGVAVLLVALRPPCADAAEDPFKGLVNFVTFFGPPTKVTVNMEPDAPEPTDPDTWVTKLTCQYLMENDVTLPVAWRIVWMSVSNDGVSRYMSDNPKTINGTLRVCPKIGDLGT